MKRKIVTGLLAMALSSAYFYTQAFAGQWLPDDNGWQYQNDDGSYATSQWIKDENNLWYYCNENGYWDPEKQGPQVDYISSKKEINDYTYRLVLTAHRYNGETIWTYETKSTRRTSTYGVQYFEQDQVVYVVENGEIHALDRNTSALIWSNSDFGGVNEAHIFDSDGTLYISGYNGPDLMAIDYEGNTLWKVESSSNSEFHPENLTLNGEYITVTFSNPSGKHCQKKYYIHDPYNND